MVAAWVEEAEYRNSLSKIGPVKTSPHFSERVSKTHNLHLHPRLLPLHWSFPPALPYDMEGTSKVQYILVLLLLGVLLAAHGATSEVTYTFGVNLALNESQSGSFSSVQLDAFIGYSIWKDWWNSRSIADRTTRSGVTFKVDLHVEQFSDYSTIPGNQETLFQTYYNMSKNTSIDFFLSPVACPWGVALRNYSYYELGIPLMVGMWIQFTFSLGYFTEFPCNADSIRWYFSRKASGDSSEAFYAVPGSFGTPTANILYVMLGGKTSSKLKH
jgi:hypothetical protein